MKNILLISFAILTQFCSCATLDLPNSESQAEFKREVIEFIVHYAENGIDIGGPNNREQESLIKNDLKSWELGLSEIIANPVKYGSRTSGIAFYVARLRGTQSSPMIIDSIIQFFDEVASIIDSQVNAARQTGVKVAKSDYYQLGELIPYLLEIDNSELLTRILRFVVSKNAIELGALRDHTPFEVAAAFRQQGRVEHVQYAMRLAELLEAADKADLANDIKRTVKRLEESSSLNGRAERRPGTSGELEDKVIESESKENISYSVIAWFCVLAAFGVVVWAWIAARSSKVSK